MTNRADISGRQERAAANAFTVAWLSQGRATAARYLAPDAQVLAAQLPAAPVESEVDARRLVVSGLVDTCGSLPLFQSSGARCVTYLHGRRISLVRVGGARRVVGFTKP